MEKKIEDYLHLYLGCEMQYCDGEVFTFIGLPNIFGELHAEGRLSTNKTSAYPLFTVKLLLRHLSDMTDEEKQCWFNSVSDGKHTFVEAEWVTELNGKPCEQHWTLWTDDYKFGRLGYTVGINNHFSSEQFIWLLSKHFDLFGLIESGLAINKTTAAQQQNT